MKILNIIVIVLCSISTVYSQDSLSHYLTIAAKNNPAILQKYSEYQASLKKVSQAGSLPDPELSTGIFLTPMEQLGGNQVAEIQFMQMFPWFGTLKSAKDEIGAMALAEYENFREIRLMVLLNLQSTWYELYKNKKNLEVTLENLETLRTIERIALIRFSSVPTGTSSATASSQQKNRAPDNAQPDNAMNGMGETGNAGPAPKNPMSSGMPEQKMSSGSANSLTDLYRIQIEIGDLEIKRASLLSRQKSLLAEFNKFLNRNPETSVLIPDTLIADTSNTIPSTIHDSMIVNNPMLVMLQHENKSIESRKKMISGMGKPMFGIGVNYAIISESEMQQSEMNGRDMVMPMFTLTLPIYRKKYKSMKEEADLLASSNLYNLNDAVRTLQAEYYGILESVNDSKRRIQLYSNQKNITEKILGILISSLATSTSDLEQVLLTNQQVLNYELLFNEAVADFNKSMARFDKLSGKETF